MKQRTVLVLLAGIAAASPGRAADKGHGTTVCMTLPRVAVSDAAPIINSFSESLRTQIETTMAGPLLESRHVDSHLAAQARAEAVELKCKYVLSVTFNHSPNSKIGKHSARTAMEVGQAARNVASSVGSVSSRANNALGAASSIGGLLANHSSRNDDANTSAAGGGFYPLGKNDKVGLAWSLDAADGDTVIKKGEYKGKVSKDNEPLLDTYIEQMANEVLTAVSH